MPHSLSIEGNKILLIQVAIEASLATLADTVSRSFIHSVFLAYCVCYVLLINERSWT